MPAGSGIAGATVTVYPQQAEIRSEQDLTVSASPRQGEVSGQVAEVTVSGSRTQIPADSTRTDGVSGGEVTIINQTGNDQVLIPTTRLLTSDGTLFRIKSRVNVPAHGRIKTRVYADKPGASGDIGPSAFTIPGLSADLQKSITAQSESPMTGGVVASGVLSQSDIDKAEADLREELLGQAKDELAAARDARDGTKHALFMYLKPGPTEIMPLFDRMEKADEEKHGANAKEWRTESVSALRLSIAATQILTAADVMFVGQLQDRMQEDPETWWEKIEGLSQAMALAVADRLNEFIEEQTGK